MHLIARAISQGGEEQSRLDGRIQAGRAAKCDGVDLHAHRCSQQRGGGAPAVNDDHDMAVAFGAPLANHEFGGAGGCPPVDVARVVALDVGAQGIELGAGSAQRRRCGAFQFVQARQTRGQQDTRLELRQDRQGEWGLE